MDIAIAMGRIEIIKHYLNIEIDPKKSSMNGRLLNFNPEIWNLIK